jgi:hypothetical protein
MVFDKPLESINEEDLQSLIESQKAEQKTVEYKRILPGNADSEKKSSLLIYHPSLILLEETYSMVLKNKQAFLQSLLVFKSMTLTTKKID